MIRKVDRAARARTLRKMLFPYQVKAASVDYLVRRNFTPNMVKKRLARMKREGVKMSRITRKLTWTNKEFDAWLERQGLTEMQFASKEMLVSEGLSEEAALRVVSKKGKISELDTMRKKVRSLRAMKLDPAVYGVEKIPMEFIERGLALCPSELNKGRIQRAILLPLEDRHAARKLSRALSSWSKSKTLKRYRPATIIKKVEVALANGIKPTPYIIKTFTAEQIARGEAVTPDLIRLVDLMQHLRRSNFLSQPRREARLTIVSEVISRPHASVKTTWLRQHVMAKHNLKGDSYLRVLEDLSLLGVISRKRGYIKLTKHFRGDIE